MKVRINRNYGVRNIKIRIASPTTPLLRANNREVVPLKGGSARTNKATVNSSRLTSAFKGETMQKSRMAPPTMAQAGQSRRMYMNQTAQRYPNAANLADM